MQNSNEKNSLRGKNLTRQMKNKFTDNNATIIRADQGKSIIIRYCDEPRKK